MECGNDVTKESTPNLGTNKSAQHIHPITSDRREIFLAKDVFLSHSGKQKSFVRQLYRDLTNQSVSCFFDQDPESLPLGEDFPSRIFEAANTCKVAVLVLSMDFLETKWPMVELAAFVEARDVTRTNPNLKILPLFFLISPAALRNFQPNNEKWEQLGISEEERTKWYNALNALRRINGPKFSEVDDEGEFIDKIVKEIWHMIKPSSRYHVRHMQGQVRMCQEVADFFNKIHLDKKRIGIAGLYGIPGVGKTTLGKAFCNFKLAEFEGKVCHLEFSRGDPLQKVKLALQYLSQCPPWILQTLTNTDQAKVEFDRRVKGCRVLLVLDNITEENIDEVRYFVEADVGKDSCILLSARSLDVLVKHFNVERQWCMRVPSLEKEEALGVLLERTFIEESMLGEQDRMTVLKCAERCSFKEVGWTGGTFHPLALKAFAGHLFSKYGSHLSKWNAEIEGSVHRPGYGLDGLWAVLGKAFDNIRPEYRTIFMLLTVYMLPNMSTLKTTQWLALICNKEILFIEKAVQELCMKAFIEEFDPEIRIHDLFIEFAQSKANEMGRWLWWRGDPPSTRGLISSEGNGGFELAKLEHCIHRTPSQIVPRDSENLFLLQLVDVQNMSKDVQNMSKLDLGGMGRLRGITLQKCKNLAEIEGMENLQQLAFLQISEANPMFKLPRLSRLQGLQHIEIYIAVSKVPSQLGDLTGCVFLREINVCCPSLSEFPKLNGLPYLEKVEFRLCNEVKGPLNCRGSVELQSIVLDSCSKMVSSPLLGGCQKLYRIVVWECDAMSKCGEIYVPSDLKTLQLYVSSKAGSAPKRLKFCYGLENLQLWNIERLRKLPSFRFLSNLSVLSLGKCGIQEPPDLRYCPLLEDVSFFQLIYLKRFPQFSGMSKLKRLILCDCWSVVNPPDISGCHQLQVFHLVYNDNMERLPTMGELPQLQEIKLSWRCEERNVDSTENVERCNVVKWEEEEEWSEPFHEEMNFSKPCNRRLPPSVRRFAFHVKRNVRYLKMKRAVRHLQSPVKRVTFSYEKNVLEMSSEDDEDCSDYEDLQICQELVRSNYEDLQLCLERSKYETVSNMDCVPRALKEWDWLDGREIMVKKYKRRKIIFHTLTAPYKLYISQFKKNSAVVY